MLSNDRLGSADAYPSVSGKCANTDADWACLLYTSGLIVWMRHPILGSGYGNLTELMAFDYNINNKGFSNSIMAVLATGGLWMSILYIASFVGLFEKKNNVQKFSICYLYLFVSTIFFARYIAIVLLAFGLALLMKKYKLKIN